MFKLLRGVGVPPAVVRAVRTLTEVVVLAVIGQLIVLLEQMDWRDYAQVAPLGFLALRAVEGLADQIDPGKKRVVE